MVVQIVSTFSIRKTCFSSPPALIKRTIRCTTQDESVTRLREMRRKVRNRCSDLRARSVQEKPDDVGSRLASILGPVDVPATDTETDTQKVVPKRKRSKDPIVKLPSINTSQPPVAKASVYPFRRRIVDKVDDGLPFRRSKSPTSTMQQYELYSLSRFTGGNFERHGGQLPWSENVFPIQHRSPPQTNKDFPKTDVTKIIDSLSDEQRNAVLVHPSKACRILAGPGSGKTRVLTHRFAYLVETHKISPFKILAVTFTNKAAMEMSERIVTLLHPEKSKEDTTSFKQKLAVGTFHSVSARLLRKYGERIGVPRDFDICDWSDSRTILSRVMKKAAKVEKVDAKTVSQALATISKIKNSTEETMMKSFRYRKFSELRDMYDEALKRGNQLDFDDLLLETRRLLKDCPDVLEELQNRYESVLVDEWQDTNRVQFDIVSLLAERRRNLFVVGDVDQSIYKFRGADSGNLQTFSETFPEAVQFTLERNYRSSRCIVEAAQYVINEDKKRPWKSMNTTNEFGNKIVVQETRNCKHEAMFVVSQLKHLKTSGQLRRFSDAAVMYRTNAQSRQLEEAFMLANLPYRLHSGIRFYERAEIKDILGYIKLVSNPQDDVSFRRIVNTPPRGIGPRTIAVIEQYAEKESLPLLGAVSRMVKSTQQNPDEWSLRPQTVRSLICFCNLLYDLRRSARSLSVNGAVGATADWPATDSLRPKEQPSNVGELVVSICDGIGYRDFLNAGNHDGLSAAEKKLQRHANVDELIQSASRYQDVREFLETVALMSNTDHSDQAVKSTPVSLMTLHSGKGLEFKAVFIVGAEDDVIPTVRHGENLEDMIDEERRLLYVGMTRAKCFLYITWRKSKLIFGKKGMMESPGLTKPSRFLDAIPPTNVSSVMTTS